MRSFKDFFAFFAAKLNFFGGLTSAIQKGFQLRQFVLHASDVSVRLTANCVIPLPMVASLPPFISLRLKKLYYGKIKATNGSDYNTSRAAARTGSGAYGGLKKLSVASKLAPC